MLEHSRIWQSQIRHANACRHMFTNVRTTGAWIELKRCPTWYERKGQHTRTTKCSSRRGETHPGSWRLLIDEVEVWPSAARCTRDESSVRVAAFTNAGGIVKPSGENDTSGPLDIGMISRNKGGKRKRHHKVWKTTSSRIQTSKGKGNWKSMNKPKIHTTTTTPFCICQW